MKGVLIALAFAFSVLGFVLAWADASKVKQVVLEVTPYSYENAVDLCRMYMHDSHGRVFGSVRLTLANESSEITLPCSVIAGQYVRVGGK